MSALERVGAVAFNNRLHVSLMPAMLTLFWGVALALPLPLEYYVMITLQTAGAYWWNMLTDEHEDSINYPRQGRFIWPDSPWSKLLIAACLVTSFLLALEAGWRFILFGAVLNAFGALYGLKVRLPAPFRVSFRIKNVPLLKNAYSSLFWSVALVLSPYLYLRLPLERRAWVAVALSFLLAFFVELLWDVRDVVGDRLAGVRTLPLLLGENRSRWLLHAVNAACTLIWLLCLVTGVLPPPYWVLMVHSLGVTVFVEWYFRGAERQWASHFYLLFAGVIIILVVALGEPDRTILPGLMRGRR